MRSRRTTCPAPSAAGRTITVTRGGRLTLTRAGAATLRGAVGSLGDEREMIREKVRRAGERERLKLDEGFGSNPGFFSFF